MWNPHDDEQVVEVDGGQDVLSDEVKEWLNLKEVDDGVITGEVSPVDYYWGPVEAEHHIGEELILNMGMRTSKFYLTSRMLTLGEHTFLK